MRITDRKSLTQYLEKHLTHTYENIKDEKKLKYEQNYLKTYIVESNLNNITEMSLPNGIEVDMKHIENDKYLYSYRISDGKKDAQFFIDTISGRFWLLHTISDSNNSDYFIEKIVEQNMSGLDHLWFSTQFMEEIWKAGISKGFTLRFENEFFDGEVRVPIKSLSMRLWGETALKVLKTLKKDEDLSGSIALSGIGLKKFLSDEDFIINDISYWAKFTARGTSIDAHYNLIENILQSYKWEIENIEKSRLKYRKATNGFLSSGEPLTIEFDPPIEHLGVFLQNLFASRKPFRLFGIWKFLRDDYAKVSALDLHNGDEIDLEVSNRWMRIYLPDNTCGNTALRLITNIQHYYSSRATLFNNFE